MSNGKITISLTDARPVTISRDAWPVVASAHDWDGQYEFQSFRHWRIKVRMHEDGRAVVYGWHDTAHPHECDMRGGYLVPADNEDALVRAIRDVGAEIGMQECCIQSCIGDLPAVEVI